jgi:putative addiction module killer protein
MKVIEIRKTGVFAKWLDRLKDIRARALVLARIERMALGNPGDIKVVGQGVSEMRIHHGPGYRIYFTKRDKELVILLAGGSKRSQAKDIKTAIKLVQSL